MSKAVLNRPSRWFCTSFRVRYQESDQMGVVYHANYLNWFEIGRTEMIRELGFAYRDMEEAGALLPVVDLELSYRSPARYDDVIHVFTRMTAFSPLRIHYEYEVRRLTAAEHESIDLSRQTEDGGLPGELLVSGVTRHVWVNREWKASRLDKSVPKLYDALRNSLTEGKE